MFSLNLGVSNSRQLILLRLIMTISKLLSQSFFRRLAYPKPYRALDEINKFRNINLMSLRRRQLRGNLGVD